MTFTSSTKICICKYVSMHPSWTSIGAESETSVYIPRILGSENSVALFIIHMFLLNKINSKLCASSRVFLHNGSVTNISTESLKSSCVCLPSWSCVSQEGRLVCCLPCPVYPRYSCLCTGQVHHVVINLSTRHSSPSRTFLDHFFLQ